MTLHPLTPGTNKDSSGNPRRSICLVTHDITHIAHSHWLSACQSPACAGPRSRPKDCSVRRKQKRHVEKRRRPGRRGTQVPLLGLPQEQGWPGLCESPPKPGSCLGSSPPAHYLHAHPFCNPTLNLGILSTIPSLNLSFS